ncbi:MAG TPA: class II aldolase/adducin family protein [Candidatus Sumerlaeota bacterium]|nr:MAG: L-fuculose phosphate aldolase [candidate division BRC1 bacterium ADurb.BinA292]HOE97754.1 class II aldolase/adducin family protein [Candidatus Sumerlaeota bacterium]HOR28780.1 class II aldolase/adducin family protein [Candidatus Sumerlaeota bacterium]HPK01313.1 class II aldolase/adducin family protein [Candidatus Sumerlaeota bacterium]
MQVPPVAPFADTTALRRQVIDTCFLMRDRLGYFISTWGNMSVRVEEGLLLTPTRVEYEDLTPEDLCVVSLDGRQVKGTRTPTSETEMHRQILRARPDLGALIHSHSTWASTCACAQRAIPVLIDDMAMVVGGEVRCSRYVPAGRHKELAAAVCEALGDEAWAVLIANHGVIAGGRTLEEAVICCQFVEKAARIFIQAEAIGGVRPIPEELWREERHHYLFKYGKTEDLKDVLKAAPAER